MRPWVEAFHSVIVRPCVEAFHLVIVWPRVEAFDLVIVRPWVEECRSNNDGDTLYGKAQSVQRPS